jgi:hypothetical protein
LLLLPYFRLKKKNTLLVKIIESAFEDPKSLKMFKTHFQQKLKNEAFAKKRSFVFQTQFQTCS